MAEKKSYDSLPDVTEEERSNDVDINAILSGRKKEIAQSEQKSDQPTIAPSPNYSAAVTPNNPLAQYAGVGGSGREVPQSNLTTEDIFPGLIHDRTILDMASAPMIGSYALYGSATPYMPYNILEKRKVALNNAAILKHKKNQEVMKNWDFDPDKTPHQYTSEYNESFYKGVHDKFNKYVNEYGGNAVKATEAVMTPGTSQYLDFHNWQSNQQALAENLTYVNDFAQRVAGTKAKSALARYYPPEAIKIATDVLSGNKKIADMGKDGNKVSDLVDQMRGYDNLISTMAKPEFKSMLAPDIQKIESRVLSSTKDAAGKYTVDEKKLNEYQMPDETIKRIMDNLGQSGLTFPSSQEKKMPQIIGNMMKSMVREKESMSTETPPQQWSGAGYDTKKMWYDIAKPEEVHGYRSTAPGIKFGVKGAPDLPENTFQSARGAEITGKPVDVVNFGSAKEPNLFLQMQVPILKRTAQELAGMKPEDRVKYYSEIKEKVKKEFVPLSGDAGHNNREKFSGEYSIQDIDQWYKDEVQKHPELVKGTAAPTPPQSKPDDLRSKYGY